MSKNDSNEKPEKPPTTPEEAIARGGVQVSRLKPNNRVLIDTTVGTLFTLKLLDEFSNLVEIWSTDPKFRTRQPVVCYFLCSWVDARGDLTVPDWVLRGARMQFRFRDADMLSGAVSGVTVEGTGWHYKLF